jgi:hypothetical protein
MSLKIPIGIPILDISGMDNNLLNQRYIDYIIPEQLINQSVMTGTDSHNRIFIVIKINIDNMSLMQTFHQKFSQIQKIGCSFVHWLSAGHYGGGHLIDTTNGVKYNQFKLIENLINNKIVKITPKHDPCIPIFINKYACNETVYNAIIIIQRAWILCRYNPEYKMCETVLMNNLEQIVQHHN